MDNLIKTLCDATDEIKQLIERVQTYDTMKEVFDGTLKRFLFKCVLDDVECTIVEYILAENEDKAIDIFGWRDNKYAKVELVMDEEDFTKLLRTFIVRTVDEDY